MKLIILILNDVSELENVLHELSLAGVKGATVLNSMGVGINLLESKENSHPLLYSLRKVVDGAKPYNKTVMMVVEEEKVDKVFEVVEEVLGNLSQPEKGIMFTLPLDRVAGLPKDYY